MPYTGLLPGTRFMTSAAPQAELLRQCSERIAANNEAYQKKVQEVMRRRAARKQPKKSAFALEAGSRTSSPDPGEPLLRKLEQGQRSDAGDTMSTQVPEQAMMKDVRCACVCFETGAVRARDVQPRQQDPRFGWRRPSTVQGSPSPQRPQHADIPGIFRSPPAPRQQVRGGARVGLGWASPFSGTQRDGGERCCAAAVQDLLQASIPCAGHAGQDAGAAVWPASARAGGAAGDGGCFAWGRAAGRYGPGSGGAERERTARLCCQARPS